ncbi:MAG TPA: hypothetical protein PLB49_17635, partial [Chitinophagaceae bacterium]|nr:hypothetical protein [Chitinophagaceae bacterium]
MKKYIPLFLLLAGAIACTDNKNTEPARTTPAGAAYSVEGKKVIAYSTADSSELRLTLTDTLVFADKAQPF